MECSRVVMDVRRIRVDIAGDLPAVEVDPKIGRARLVKSQSARSSTTRK